MSKNGSTRKPDLVKDVENGVIKGSKTKVQPLLNECEPASPFKIDQDGMNLIHSAAKSGDVDRLRQLLKHIKKQDIDATTKDGCTALHLAVKYKKLESVKCLLTAGANPQLLDCNGRSPIHIAARRGSIDLLKLFISHPDINVNIKGNDDATPLHSSAGGSNFEACTLLLKAGADVLSCDSGGQTPLTIAAGEKNSAIVKLFIQTAQAKAVDIKHYLNKRDDEGSAAIHLAALNNQIDNLMLLLDAGVNVSAEKSDGSTALHVSCTLGYLKLTEILLQRGMPVDIKNHLGTTPLHRAAQYNHSDCAELLISKGASIDETDGDGNSPLFLAVQKGNSEMMMLMLKFGADLHQVDEEGRTILHWLVKGNREKCIDALCNSIERSSLHHLIAAKDGTEQTPLHMASQYGNIGIIKKLLELGAATAVKDEQDKTPLHLAAEYGHSIAVEALLKHGKEEINDDDVDGRTPLLLACYHGHYDCVQAILKLGGDVSSKSRDETNHSAFTLAAYHGNLDIVKLLLDNDANMEERTKYKETALHLACKGNHPQVVEFLLEKSADLTARNTKHETPFDVAIENRSQEAASAIISSSRWKEAMSCFDKAGHNPLPKLIAFLPKVAEQVLDRCITLEGEPDKEDFALVYNFEYLDIHPDMGKEKIWYTKDMAEQKRENLLLHELVLKNFETKRAKLLKVLITDMMYYMMIIILLMVFIYMSPKPNTSYEDQYGCPLMLTEEEANNQTLYDYYYETGALDRISMKPMDMKMKQIMSYMMYAVIGISLLRFLALFWALKLYFLTRVSTYTTAALLGCMIYISTRDQLVLCGLEWRLLWIAMLLAWSNQSYYLVRAPKIGIYCLMFYSVLVNVIRVLLSISFVVVAFSVCFHITLSRFPEFENPVVAVLATFDLALGEISYVDRAVKMNHMYLQTDNHILMVLMMVVLPISFMNLLVGLAVGDIEAIRNSVQLHQIDLRVTTIFEYEYPAPKFLQRSWYTKAVYIYPNKSKSIKCIDYIKKTMKKSVYEASKGWSLASERGEDEREDNYLDYIKIELERQNTQMKEIKEGILNQDKLLQAIAEKLSLK